MCWRKVCIEQMEHNMLILNCWLKITKKIYIDETVFKVRLKQVIFDLVLKGLDEKNAYNSLELDQ